MAHIEDGGAATAIVSLVRIATIQTSRPACPAAGALSLVLLVSSGYSLRRTVRG